MMKMSSLRLVALVGTIATAIPLVANGALQAEQTNPPPANTGTNKQDGLTADQQSQTKADLDLVKAIRQAIVKDKTLSTDAHNCKVITKDGTVTLRGPVDSAKEKDAVGAIATDIAGTGNVTNVLVVKPGK